MRALIYGDAKKPSVAQARRAPAETETRSLAALKGHAASDDEVAYLDASGLDADELAKAIATLRRRAKGKAWGVVDPKGALADPGRLFLDGASDYLGPAACREGLDRARLKAVAALAVRQADSASSGAEAPAGLAIAPGTNGTACGDGGSEPSFPGWKNLRAKTSYPFYFLYASVSAQMNLKTRLGEAGYRAFRDRLRLIIQQGLAEADALPWMETDAGALYLVPPGRACGRVATAACLRMLLGAPLMAYERLCLPFPVELTFALHYGTSEYAPPGRTGTIVSDAVNFSHHLGSKRAEPGRLTLSDSAGGVLEENRLADLFLSAGSFEGRSLLHSRRFGSA